MTVERYAITYKGLAKLLELRLLAKHPEVSATISALLNMPYPHAKATPFVQKAVQDILDSFDRADATSAFCETLLRAPTPIERK
jgi:hypothetical protein